MSIEITAEKAICFKCGTAYGRRKGNFPVSYASMHKGVGHLPVCKTCVDNMYNSYLAQCQNAKDAVRQMCRKLDLFWSEKAFEAVEKKTSTRTMMTQYIAKINAATYAGKSYDDSLSQEGTLWSLGKPKEEPVEAAPQNDTIKTAEAQTEEVPDDVVAFWGYGYSPEMYSELEQRRAYWTSNLPEGTQPDMMTEALLR